MMIGDYVNLTMLNSFPRVVTLTRMLAHAAKSYPVRVWRLWKKCADFEMLKSADAMRRPQRLTRC